MRKIPFMTRKPPDSPYWVHIGPIVDGKTAGRSYGCLAMALSVAKTCMEQGGLTEHDVSIFDGVLGGYITYRQAIFLHDVITKSKVKGLK